MFDFLLGPDQLALRDEVRDLVRWVPRQMILDMDADKVRFPREFLREAGRRGLLGVRYPKQWGGRDLDWVTTCMVMEEVGTLGYIFACVFGVGAELVCDAIVCTAPTPRSERYVQPLLAGELFAAECLTEPRGGSDFFGTTTIAEDRGDHFVLNGQKRFIVGAEGADYFLVYARTDPEAQAAARGSPASSSTAARAWRSKYLYGLMGCRGGGAGRIVFQRREGAAGERAGQAPRRRRGLQHDDDPRAAGHRRDDHRRGAPGPGGRHAATPPGARPSARSSTSSRA